MKKTVILFFLFIWTACKSYKPARKTTQINEVDKEVYDILNAALESLDEDKIYLYDGISSSAYNYWISHLTDSYVLKATDSSLIKKHLAIEGIKEFLEPELIAYYQKKLKKMKLDAKYLSKNKQIELFDNRLIDIYPKYLISYPVLSFNKEYAWLTISKSNDERTGVIYTKLLKNEAGKWKFHADISIKPYLADIKKSKVAIPVSSLNNWIKKNVSYNGNNDTIAIINYVINNMNDKEKTVFINELESPDTLTINLWRDYTYKYADNDSIKSLAFNDKNMECYYKQTHKTTYLTEVLHYKEPVISIPKKSAHKTHFKKNYKIMSLSYPLISCDKQIAIIKKRYYNSKNEVWVEPEYLLLVKRKKIWQFY